MQRNMLVAIATFFLSAATFADDITANALVDGSPSIADNVGTSRDIIASNNADANSDSLPTPSTTTNSDASPDTATGDDDY